VRAQKTGFLAQRTLWRKPCASADYPGFFINALFFLFYVFLLFFSLFD
jgi:hypothetical protein